MQFLPGSSSHIRVSMRLHNVVLLPNRRLHHRRLTHTRLPFLPVQVRYRRPHKPVRSLRLRLPVLTVGLHRRISNSRISNSRTWVSHRRFPPARPVFPLRLGLLRVLEVSKSACHRLVLLAKAKQLLPLSIVSFLTFILVEAEEFL
jgi:hypothetical protein